MGWNQHGNDAGSVSILMVKKSNCEGPFYWLRWSMLPSNGTRSAVTMANLPESRPPFVRVARSEATGKIRLDSVLRSHLCNFLAMACRIALAFFGQVATLFWDDIVGVGENTISLKCIRRRWHRADLRGRLRCLFRDMPLFLL